MNKILLTTMIAVVIAILLAIFVAIVLKPQATRTVIREMGWGGSGAIYLTKAPTHGTTTIQGCKRTMEYGTDKSWHCATTTAGDVPLLVDENTDRYDLDICINETDEKAIRFWLTNTTTSAMFASTSDSNGILLTPGNCWNMADYGIIWGGHIYALTSTTEKDALTGVGSSTVHYTDYTQ